MNGIAAYKENAVTTQPRGRLVVLLYEGAIKFLRQAEGELQAGNFLEKGRYISKAQAIIMELNAALDMERGKDISKTLRSLYDFMIRHLNRANMERDQKFIEDVILQLERLNEGWRAITA